MKRNPFNPLDWVNIAQTWFTRTERSSGFRPFLIFLLLLFGFCITLLCLFRENSEMHTFVFNVLYLGIGSFVFLFAIKAFQEPDFCRSEQHIENVRRLELMEQKGDSAPKIISAETTEVITNPAVDGTKRLEDGQ